MMGLGSKKPMAEGGLYQEGGAVDEMSGNEVPVGSLKSEVRDDIDAKLSEGEFVFPADVVRFVGLDKLMKIRDEAKRGLKRMDAIGQMGNAEEASEEGEEYEDEDEKGFTGTIDEILGEMGEEKKFAQGGVVEGDAAPAADAAMAPPAPAPSGAAPAASPSTVAQGVNMVMARNKEGDELFIPVINDALLFSVPDGYEIERKTKGYKVNDKGRAIPDSIDPETADAIGELLSALTGSKVVSQKTREYVQAFNAENIKKAVAANLS